MPVKSRKQFRWMETMKNNPEKAEQANIKPIVAKDFLAATPAYKSLPEVAPVPKVKKPKKQTMDY